MTYWSKYETVAGHFDPKSKTLAIDYAAHTNSDDFFAVYAHESMHKNLCTRTDYGQASELIAMITSERTDLTDSQKDEIEDLIVFKSQKNVQESLAILYASLYLRKEVGRIEATRRMLEKYTKVPEYLEWFNQIEFVLSMSEDYRNKFLDRAQILSMQTGIRKDLVKMDLLKTPENLALYLQNPDKNPSERFTKLLDAVRRNNWLATKPLDYIAEKIGIKYYEPTSKQEAEECVKYCFSIIGKSPTIIVSDTPPASTLFKTPEEISLVNLNLNIAKDGLWWKPQDFFDFADQVEVIMPLLHFLDLPDIDLLRSEIDQEPEAGLIGINHYNAKHLTTCNIAFAKNAIMQNFADATFAIKGEAFFSSEYIEKWMDGLREPDVVIYTTASDFVSLMKNYVEGSNKKFLLRIGRFTTSSPQHTVLIQEVGHKPIHWVNILGDAPLQSMFDVLNNSVEPMPIKNLGQYKRHLNNIFAVWNNLSWDIDWVAGMEENLE